MAKILKFPNIKKQTLYFKGTVDGKYIKDNIGELVKDTDLSKFIL